MKPTPLCCTLLPSDVCETVDAGARIIRRLFQEEDYMYCIVQHGTPYVPVLYNMCNTVCTHAQSRAEQSTTISCSAHAAGVLSSTGRITVPPTVSSSSTVCIHVP